MKLTVDILDGEYWYGGSSDSSGNQPFSRLTEYKIDYRDTAGNQTMPLLLSTKGRYIWSEHAFLMSISDGVITLDGEDIALSSSGSTLRDAYLHAMREHFPFSGKLLPEKFFETAQYNTWMEYTYNPTQERVLEYAHAIVDNGYEPGILIIDEGWHIHYGCWEFDFVKFPDPKAMVDELHALGFTVMLWVVPFVTADNRAFLDLENKDIKYEGKVENKSPLLQTDEGRPALVHWWNGYSCILNFCLPEAVEYLDKRLHHLMDDYGVDGFKFDGGSIGLYHPKSIVNGTQTKYTPEELNIAWNEFGERYTYHEYKDTFKGGGKSVIQRIRDRGHRWGGDGLESLIPFALVQGLIGHPFICPDMIGGGEWSFNLIPDFKCDEELFVRMAECSSLFPMMQFSWAPWRLLSAQNQEKCLGAAKLHKKFAEFIKSEVARAAHDGEPIVRAIEYNYPNAGFECTVDAFMLGERYLVCPVIKRGEVEREVKLPEGKWLYCDGTLFDGGKTVCVSAPLGVLPYFEKIQ